MLRLSRRFASQALLSGSVMVALHALGGGAGLTTLIFGKEDGPAPAVEAPLPTATIGPMPGIDQSPAAEPAGADAPPSQTLADATSAPKTSSEPAGRQLAEATPPKSRSGKDQTIPAGVILFDTCLRGCESRDPLLADDEMPKTGSGRGAASGTHSSFAAQAEPDDPDLAARITRPIATGARFVSGEVGSLVDGAGSALSSAVHW
ncbi:hypothetical protein E3C22_21005 [Jiella endophytica]|uniref:Uncharacterized protein n=1 Tax=Jiella endophytica TaxID=2558362 RepID=A0A4Y8RBB7_9HYPH|nr:hypothetical protein [Jiella endophytica]TFF18708.1 hypothetical protein E3C22_21005 [Jiella endophytica]